jgi:hypothetical protein
MSLLVARSVKESVFLCNQHSFQLIVSTVYLTQSNPVFAELMKTNCAIFFSYTLRNACG